MVDGGGTLHRPLPAVLSTHPLARLIRTDDRAFAHLLGNRLVLRLQGLLHARQDVHHRSPADREPPQVSEQTPEPLTADVVVMVQVGDRHLETGSERLVGVPALGIGGGGALTTGGAEAAETEHLHDRGGKRREFHLLAAVADVAGHAAQIGATGGAGGGMASDGEGGLGTLAAVAGMTASGSFLLGRRRGGTVLGKRLAGRDGGVAGVLAGAG